MKQCNYCKKPATVWFAWVTWVRSRGHRKALTVEARACSEHEGCANWNSNRALHSDAPLQRVAHG